MKLNGHPPGTPPVEDDGYLTRLCENVFELSATAERLRIDRAITVKDSRELFHCVLDWAKEFEQDYDPNGGEDYLMSIETFGNQKILETFPYDPELADPEGLSSDPWEAPTIRLKDLVLLGLPPANVYLVHKRSDVGTVPASGLRELTDQGRKEFSDLLNAKVEAIHPGAYGVELVMTGILPERLADFDRAQAAMLRAGPYLGMFQTDGAVPAPDCPEEAVQAVRDYLCFERDTTEVWPWFLSAEEMLYYEKTLREIGAALHPDPEHGYDTEEIHQALNEAFGVNPTLEEGQTMAP